MGLYKKPNHAIFCRSWQTVLSKYGARYFHFNEWSTASAVARQKRQPPSTFTKNPYKGWDAKKLDAFLLELAKVIGTGDKLIVGGFVRTNLFHEAKAVGKVPIGANPHEVCIKWFFEEFLQVVEEMRPSWKRMPVTFIFDQNDDEEWGRAVDYMFCEYRKRFPKFKEMLFASKEDPKHLVLQASDMIAYRYRQITNKWVDQDASRQWPEFDNILFRPLFKYFEHHAPELLEMFLRGELSP
jgi:hypothetical protein